MSTRPVDMSTQFDFVDMLVQHVDPSDMTGAQFRSDALFNDLRELPPVAQLETPAVLKACIPARAALAELNAASELIQIGRASCRERV